MVKHDTLLICSGIWEHRQNLREIFHGTYNLLEASSISQMLLLLRQNMDCIAAALLDVTCPAKEEIEILRRAENRKLFSRVPVIVLSENDNPQVLTRGFELGASDVIPMNYDPHAMVKRVENIVDLHLHKQHLEAMVEEQRAILRHTSDTMVDALSSIIEYRSVESGQHILRIRHFTKILLEEVARCCPEYQLDEGTIAIICSASALHDIGKIAIPDAILKKPGSLTEEEREIMKSHAITGCRILDTLGEMADKEYLRYAHNICHYHHERWDGKGYPEGLRGEAIPICAQVVGLADVYDALTTRRVYKEAYAFSTAVNMILRGECGVFSPKLLECFKNVTRKFEALAQDYADGMSPKSESFDTALALPEEQGAEDSVERIHGKYYALVHYINGLLMEVDVDRQLFHLIYNPYPEWASLQEMNSLADVQALIFREFIHPEDREKMEWFLNQELPRFLEEGLRRMHYHFRAKGEDAAGELFELTLMRVNPMDNHRRTLGVLVKKVSQDAVREERVSTISILAENTYYCRNDQNFTLLDVDSRATQLAGYSLSEIRERFDGHLNLLAPPEDREMIRREFTEQLRHGNDVKLEHRIVYKDGSVHRVYNISRLIMDRDGQEMICSFLLDINGLHRGGDTLQEKLERYEIILAQTENVLFEWDVVQDTLNFSDTWEKIFGYAPESRSIQDISFLHPDDVPNLIDRLNALSKGSAYEMAEVRVATAKGRYLWCRFRATALRDPRGKLLKICGIIINIDAEKQAEQQLQNRADQDSLTRLLNKDAARRQAEEYFARYPDGVSGALLIIDLDNFKQVNDQYGHLFGDAVLTQVSREIKKLFRGQDIVARIGGDEFMVVMRGVSDQALLEQRCTQLLQTFRNLFQDNRHKLPLSCSIGIALSPSHGRSYFQLFQHADQALYRAKAKGKSCFVIYDPNDDGYLTQPGRTSVVSNAIDSDQELGMANDSIVRYAFQKLYSSRNVEDSIHEILSLAGRQMNVSRVYIFENSEDNRYCSNTFEWCNQGIRPEIDNLQNICYETDIPGYAENFDENGIFYCPDVTMLPQKVYDIVAPQGIKSMLHCAIRDNDVFRGYIGFDECREQRLWTKEQIELLTFLAESLAMFLLRLRRQEKVQKQADELRSILDNQDAWIYIIDPDTFQLNYVNGKLLKALPQVRTGVPCYQALKGRPSPCERCPARQLGSATNGNHLAYDPSLGCHVLIEAARIRWEGSEAFLMTSRKLPSLQWLEETRKNSEKIPNETQIETPV